MKSRILSLLVLGCLGISSSVLGGGSSSTGVGPPTYAFCLSQGGQVVSFQGSEGGGGFCKFGDAYIELWTFLRSSVGNEEGAISAYFQSEGNYSSPESACLASGGSIRRFTPPAGGFPPHFGGAGCHYTKGNSTIALGTLAAGPHSHVTSTLSLVLLRQKIRYQIPSAVKTIEHGDSLSLRTILEGANTPDVGLLGFRVQKVECIRIAAPSFPTTCTVDVGNLGQPVTISGEDGKMIYTFIEQLVGTVSTGHVTGASRVRAYNLICNIDENEPCSFTATPF